MSRYCTDKKASSHYAVIGFIYDILDYSFSLFPSVVELCVVSMTVGRCDYYSCCDHGG